jgi:predicted dehydrogenase
VHTTNGSIRVNHRPDDPLMRFTRLEGWKNLDIPGSTEQKLKDPTGHAGFFAAAYEALANGSEMPVTGEQARHNLAIIEAARQATEERRAIEVEVKRET